MSSVVSSRRSSAGSDTRYDDVRRSLSTNIQHAAAVDEVVDEESGMLDASKLQDAVDRQHERFSRVSTHTQAQTS